MESQWRIILLMLIPVLFGGCSKDPVEKTGKECLISIESIDFTFGIDYLSPDKYLLPGEQSDIDPSYLDEIRNKIGDPVDTMDFVLKVCAWINQRFTFMNAGGGMIGKVSVNELYELNEFYGCHSLALLISSVLRGFGFPAIMIETADVQWAYDYHSGNREYFAGHVMSEIYVEDHWILLDNNGFYVQDYDPLNPFIPQVHYPPEAYFVYAKGIDTWVYSNKEESFTHENMIYFAENIYCFEDLLNTITYSWTTF